MKDTDYIVIIPARDEADNVDITIQSILKQTILPSELILVNDGSKDDTGRIFDEYSAQYHWIKTVNRKDRGYRDSAGGEVDAFSDGLKIIEHKSWEYIVKLDADVSFNTTYFEKCFNEFEKNPLIGIGGGQVVANINGILKPEGKNPLFHVRGATKIYKRKCWEEIDGIVNIPGWDTIDLLKAQMHGWETRTFENINIILHRDTGKIAGSWKNWIKNGRANYIAGYHPIFFILKVIKRIFNKPYFIHSFGLLYGFLGGYIKKTKKIDDMDLIRFVRKEQINRLLCKDSIWKY